MDVRSYRSEGLDRIGFVSCHEAIGIDIDFAVAYVDTWSRSSNTLCYYGQP
ncbi:hypothetical protein [Vulgatibacter incomptus]|uniref:hypothetical protein n=1 Tax=Vulgatibacter incomptus TaxID=1391653 RepID=UPI0012FBF2C1|nr:hypothetical protein [Vulgatibacter incomptus]